MATKKRISVKLLIDKDHKKVLLAEAGKDFVDFLIQILSLPVVTVFRLSKKATTVGCITNLCGSLESCSQSYVQSNLPSFSIDQVNNSSTLLLRDIDAASSQKKIYYQCPELCDYVTNVTDMICPSCGSTMYTKVNFLGPENLADDVQKKKKRREKAADKNPTGDDGAGGGYATGLATYMVTDDLSITPMSMISCVTLLNKFNIKDFAALEEKVVEVGINEGLNLLKAALVSKSPLTEVFITQKKVALDASTSTSYGAA